MEVVRVDENFKGTVNCTRSQSSRNPTVESPAFGHRPPRKGAQNEVW